MFERFSDSARWVVVRAQEVAREHDHDYIGAEHLLLAVFEAAAQDRAPATRALFDRRGFTPQAALAMVTLARGANHGVDGQIPFTTEAKTALGNSLRESLALGDSTIGPDHLFVGIIRTAYDTAGSVAGQIVAKLHITADAIREALGKHPSVALTQRATETVARAGMEARRCDDTEIDTPHLMLALLTTDPELCRRVFDAAGADPERVRAELDAILAPKE